MKKILFLVLFSIVFLFALPLSGLAEIVYEVTVTITSVKIPVRAGMILAPNRPNTEFFIPRAYFTIVDKNDDVATRLPTFASASWFTLAKNVTKIITFPYDANYAPYTLNVETKTSFPVGWDLCTAGCSRIPLNSGYYIFLEHPKFFNSDSATWDYAPCPNSCASSGHEYSIALPPENVFQDTVWGGSLNFWRSPALLTIP